MRTHRKIQFGLISVDVIIIVLSSFAALLARTELSIFVDSPDVEKFVIPVSYLIIATWVLTLMSVGAYSVENFGYGVTEYKRVISSGFFVAAMTSTFAFLFKYPISRGYFVMFFLIAIPLLTLGRFTSRRLLHLARTRRRLQRDILLAGNPANVDEIATVLRRERWLGLNPTGALTPGREAVTSDDLPVVGEPLDVLKASKETRANLVVFAEGSFSSSAQFRRQAWKLEDSQVSMIVVPALTDVSAQRLEVRPIAGLPLVHVQPPQAVQASKGMKRAFDIVAALFSLVLAAPVILIVAIMIQLEDRGPVFFKQSRIGHNGRPFDFYKIRSMVVDAEARKQELADLNETDGVLFKMSNDPRITKVGRFIRRFSIDELPQLFNVLIGDMSMVGPRPALPEEVAQYDEDARRRLHVRPGLTGLWQVSGRSDLSWEETVRLDLYYVDNWSMLQDLSILLKTAGAVLRSDGAY